MDGAGDVAQGAMGVWVAKADEAVCYDKQNADGSGYDGNNGDSNDGDRDKDVAEDDAEDAEDAEDGVAVVQKQGFPKPTQGIKKLLFSI